VPSEATTCDTIVVATDGSDGGDRAVEHALELANRYGAALHAMFAVDTDRYGEPALSTAELVVNEIEDTGHELVAEVAACRGADHRVGDARDPRHTAQSDGVRVASHPTSV